MMCFSFIRFQKFISEETVYSNRNLWLVEITLEKLPLFH